MYSRSARSFGPILAERAETIGRDKFAVGFSHQNFTFNSVDAVPLRSVPSVFVHIPNLGQHVTGVERIIKQTFRAGNGELFPNARFSRGSFDSRSGAIGFKVKPIGDLIASFNVLIGITHVGLQPRVTPLAGLSYAF